MHVPAPSRVVLALVLGLGLLGLLAYLGTVGLQRDAVEEALSARGLAQEEHLRGLIRRYAAEVLDAEGGTLSSFAQRLTRAAAGNPALLALVVLDSERNVVNSFFRNGGNLPCAAMVPLDRVRDHVHPAGEAGENPVSCRSLPVEVSGTEAGLVLFHADRDWHRDGARVAAWVQRTAWRLVPLFAVFYLLLAGFLFWAARAARGWRRRAEAAARIEALGAIADGINHEIKNPLNTVGLSLQYLARKHTDAETREVVGSAEREAKRIAETLAEFARFTRVSRLAPERVAALGERLRQAGLPVQGEADASVDIGRIEETVRAMVGLLPDGATATLGSNRAGWRIEVSGEASDLDPSAVDRLFDPYVRARPRDVGRGLALARAVFQAHGGDLTAKLRSGILTLRGEAPLVPPGD